MAEEVKALRRSDVIVRWMDSECASMSELYDKAWQSMKPKWVSLDRRKINAWGRRKPQYTLILTATGISEGCDTNS